MINKSQVCSQWYMLFAVVLGMFLCIRIPSASGYTPEDPEVVAMITKGLKFLEGQGVDSITKSPYLGNDAAPVLVAYAHLKYNHDHDAAIIKMGHASAMKYVAAVKKNGGRIEVPNTKAFHAGVYEYAVVILFLAEYDPVTHKSDLELLGNALLSLQHSTGGYGYPGYETGDISQTQYVALAVWTLDYSGVTLSLDRLSRMLSWLMRVQDSSGYWPYQAKDPGLGRGLINQSKEELSVTMCLAGGGAALIAADVFRIWDSTTVGNKIQGLPKSLKPVDKSELVQQRRKKCPVKPEEVLKAMRSMESYRSKNPYHREKGGDWYYYMLYSLERYESFFEMAMGAPSNPAWYDREVETLMGLQDAAGAFGVKDPSKSNPAVSTAFAVLFLMRSSQKAIERLSKGSLAGGYEIPKDTANIKVKGTQIVKQAPATDVTNLLDILESDGANSVDGKSIPDDMKLETDPAARAAQLDRLARLVRGSSSYQARRVAARLLGKSDQMIAVAPLIYALSDPDRKVRNYALDGLNFISRQFETDKLPDQIPKREDANQFQQYRVTIRKIQEKWIKWYQTVDPTFIYTDEL